MSTEGGGEAAGTGRRRLRLGRVAGVPVLLSPSWLLVAGLITVLFGPSAGSSTGLGPGLPAYLVAFALAVLLALSVLAHEAAHAVAARRSGLHVSEVVVDLWGGHTSLGRPPTPGTSALVSVVGPLVNVVLAVGLEALRRQLPPAEPGSATAVLAYLAFGTALTNALLGGFNLVPGLPLDGGRVLEALIWRLSGNQDLGSLVAAWGGRVVAVAVVAWALLPVLAQGRSPVSVTLLWAGLIAFYLWRGASASLTVARFRLRAGRVDVAAVTRPSLVAPYGVSVADLPVATTVRPDGTPVGGGAAGGGGADGGSAGAAAGVPGPGPVDVVLLDGAGRAVAVVPGGSVAAVPVELRTTTPAAALARTLPAGAVVPVSEGALGTVEGLAHAGDVGVVLLDESGRPCGRVLPHDFAAAMGLR